MTALYYHVFIKFVNNTGEIQRHSLFGLSKGRLEKYIVIPYNKNKMFHFNGQNINPNQIQDIQILSSSFPTSSEVILPNGKPLGLEISEKTLNLLGAGRIPTVFGIVNHEFLRPLVENPKHLVSLANKYVEGKGKIFIVHGRDGEMKQAVARTLEKLECEAIILDEQTNKGRTIIEKFTDYSDVSFAVILLSPDDMGYLNGDLPANAKPRARQNVIFELGFFLGKLKRDHTIALFKSADSFEIPSDYSGVVYIEYDDAGNWKYKLTKELRACGFSVDANKL